MRFNLGWLVLVAVFLGMIVGGMFFKIGAPGSLLGYYIIPIVGYFLVSIILFCIDKTQVSFRKFLKYILFFVIALVFHFFVAFFIPLARGMGGGN